MPKLIRFVKYLFSGALFIPFFVLSGCALFQEGVGLDKLAGFELVKQDELDLIDQSSFSEPEEILVSEADSTEGMQIGAFETKLHEGEISSADYLASKRTVVTVGVDNLIKISKIVAKKNQIKSVKLIKSNQPITAISISPSERFLAIAQNSRVSLYDFSKNKIVKLFNKFSGRVSTLEWDVKEELLFIGMYDGRILSWRALDMNKSIFDGAAELEEYVGSYLPIKKIVPHSDSKLIFGLNQEGYVFIWRLRREDRELGFYDPYSRVDQQQEQIGPILKVTKKCLWKDFVFDNNSKFLIGACENGQVEAVDLKGVVSKGLFLEPGSEPLKCSLLQSKNESKLLISNRSQELELMRIEYEDVTPQYSLINQQGPFSNTFSIFAGDLELGLAYGYTTYGSLVVFDFNRIRK